MGQNQHLLTLLEKIGALSGASTGATNIITQFCIFSKCFEGLYYTEGEREMFMSSDVAIEPIELHGAHSYHFSRTLELTYKRRLC